MWIVPWACTPGAAALPIILVGFAYGAPPGAVLIGAGLVALILAYSWSLHVLAFALSSVSEVGRAMMAVPLAVLVVALNVLVAGFGCSMLLSIETNGPPPVDGGEVLQRHVRFLDIIGDSPRTILPFLRSLRQDAQ